MKKVYVGLALLSFLAFIGFSVLCALQLNGHHPYESAWIVLSMCSILLMFLFLGLFLKEKGKR